MLPILLDVRIFKIYTFGVFLVLALYWGLFWFWKNIKRTSYKEENMFDAVFIALLGGLFLSRLTYVVLHFEDFGFSFLRFILINGYPGLSLIGGLVGGVISILLVSRFLKFSPSEVLAYLVPPAFLALAIGKLGAFFGGTVVGTETEFFLKAEYVGYEGMRHLTAVYEALLLFVGFLLSQKALMSYRRSKLRVSTVISIFVIIVSLSMIVLDFIKVDPLYLGSLRFNVVIPSITAGIFIIFELITYRSLLIPKKKNDKSSPN